MTGLKPFKGLILKMKFNVVLVQTIYASNIGASARALANMGGGELILIDPKTSLNSKARQGAAGAQEQLEKHIIFNSWDEFLNKFSPKILIALSKRKGKSRPSLGHADLMQDLAEKQTVESASEVFFVFGPEDNGLSAADTHQCHFTSHLPEYGDFNSYNLAQAVLLTLFIANQHLNPLPIRPELTAQTFPFPDNGLKEWLQAIGFNLSAPKKNMYITLKNMLQRSVPTNKELEGLNMALQQTLRKLNKD